MQADELYNRIARRREKEPFVMDRAYPAWRTVLQDMCKEHGIRYYGASENMVRDFCIAGTDPDIIWAVFVLCFPDA